MRIINNSIICIFHEKYVYYESTKEERDSNHVEEL